MKYCWHHALRKVVAFLEICVSVVHLLHLNTLDSKSILRIVFGVTVRFRDCFISDRLSPVLVGSRRMSRLVLRETVGGLPLLSVKNPRFAHVKCFCNMQCNILKTFAICNTAIFGNIFLFYWTNVQYLSYKSCNIRGKYY